MNTAEFDWSSYEGDKHWLKSRTLLLTRAGSWSYGTNIESSDMDYRGVAIAPEAMYLGTLETFEQVEVKIPDLVIFDLKKLVKLASAANPNILEIMFTDVSDRIQPESAVAAELGGKLLGMRGLFVTKKVRATYAGYSASQLRKIRNNTEHSIEGSPRWKRIQEFGYDTKNAMHLVRLLRMCREILETGEVMVKRKDAAELLAIRNGAWTLAELVEYAESEDKELDAVYEKSHLPHSPDVKEIDRRCVEIMKSGLEWL